MWHVITNVNVWCVFPVRKSLFSQWFSMIPGNCKILADLVTPLPWTRWAALQIPCFSKVFQKVAAGNQWFPRSPRLPELMTRSQTYCFTNGFLLFGRNCKVFLVILLPETLIFPRIFNVFCGFPRFRGLGEGFHSFWPQIRIPHQKLCRFHPRNQNNRWGRSFITGGLLNWTSRLIVVEFELLEAEGNSDWPSSSS